MKMAEEDSNTAPHKPCGVATSSSAEEEDFNKLSAEDRMKITAPRKLTNDEVSALCKLMKNEFSVVDEETDDDADALLEYAVDMIDGGKSVDMVMKELEAMEMSVFDTTTSPKVSLILSKYLHNLMHTPPPINNETIVKSTTPQRQQVDLSPYTSPQKSRVEVKSVQTSSPRLMLLADNYRKRASISSADVGCGEGEDLDDSMMNLEQQYSSGGSHSSNKVDFDKLNTTQRMEVKASRKLETSESMGLYKLMKAQLNIENDDDDADADTLLLYALDMVNGGDTVGAVIEEIDLMEMSVCDAEAAQNVALVLSKFLYYLRPSSSDVIDVTSTAMASKNRDELQSLRSSAQSLRVLTDNYIRRVTSASSLLTMDLEDSDDPVRSGDGEIDLSARAATKKNRDEVQFIRKSSTSSLKQKSDNYMRRVSSASSFLTMDLEDSGDHPVRSGDGEIDLSARAATKKNRDEVQFIRKSSTSSLKQKSDNYMRRVSSASSFLTMDLEDSGDHPVRSGDGEIDLSARAATKKNRDEVQFIRKSSTSSLKQKSDSYIRRASASSLSSADLGDVDDSVRSGDGEIDVSAQAMTRRYRDEVFLRPSMGNLKERANNYNTGALNSSAGGEPGDLDISDYFDRGHLSSSNRDFDALSMAERMDVTACRALTTSETMTLYKMMKAKLNVADDESDEDADTLLDYAFDLMDEGESVGMVVKELEMMGMSVCDADAALRVALVLSKYLYYLRDSFEAKVDLSPYSLKKKCRDEVQSLRSNTESLETRIQNYSKRASVSGSPRERDVLGDDEQKDQKSTADVDLSALAAATKHWSELEELSTRLNFEEKMEKYSEKTSRDKMYFTSGNVVTRSGQDRDCESKSVSTTDIRCTDEGFIDVDGVFDPKQLDEEATSSLRQLLQAQLSTNSDSSEQQVSDVLDYTIDLVSSQNNIGTVIKELEFLQMDLFNANVANKFGKCLSEFLLSMERTSAESDDAKRRKELQAIMHDSSLGKKERAKKMEEVKQKYLAKSGNVTVEKASVDLSALAASKKHLSELMSLQVDGLPQQKEAIYSETGELKHWNRDSDAQNDTKSIDIQRRNELQDIMRDKSLGKDDRARKMKEVKQKYLEKAGVVDLSATAAAKKHHDELKSLPVSNMKQQKSAIYSETGELRHWAKSGTNDKPDDGALDLSTRKYQDKVDLDPDSRRKDLFNTNYEKKPSLDSQRREELQMIMQDKSLGKVERAKKIEEVKQKYVDMTEETERGTRTSENEPVNPSAMAAAKEHQSDLEFLTTGVVDLSATAAAKKHHDELKSLPVSNMKQQKSAIYSETGELRHWAKSGTNDKPDDGALDLSTRKYQDKVDLDPDSRRKDLFNTNYEKKPSLDSQRREELQMIMQDKSLGKVERAKKIEEVKQKYVAMTEETERGTRTSENEPVNPSAMAEHQNDLEFLTMSVLEKDALKQPKTALYSETGELKQWRNDDDIDNKKTKKGDGIDVSTKKYAEIMKYDPDSKRKEYYDNQFLTKPSLGSRRRDELQAIMQDKSLGKEERVRKMEEVKRKYIVQVEAELDIMRSKELQDIVKEKSVGKGERVKRMKEVKLKYEQKLQMLI